MFRRFVSNASANVFSGVATAIFQLAIVGISSRTWHGAEFTSWALAFSVAAIAPIFAANLSSVVTRRVIESRHNKINSTELAVILAGRRVGNHLSCAALILLFSAGAFLHVQSGSKVVAAGSFLWTLLVLLLANVWWLLWQVRFGQHYADERNWLPALTLGAARLGGIVGMIAGLMLGKQSMITAASGLFFGTWLALAFVSYWLPKPRYGGSSDLLPTKLDIGKQTLNNYRLLSGFAVGSLSTLVIQYSLSPLMALIAPKQFNAFYLASTLNLVTIGVLAAAMSAMLAPLTRWHSRSEAPLLRRFTMFSPALFASCCLVILCLCWYATNFLPQILALRVASLADIRTFLALLGFQTIIRNAAAGYAMYIAAAGTPRQMSVPLVVEISLAIAVAVPLGLLYDDRAFIYGLMAASLIGSLSSSKVLASVKGSSQISFSATLLALFGAQTAVSGLWWLIVKGSL